MTGIRLTLFALLTAGLVGCVSHQPVQLYQLSSGEAGVPQRDAGPRILVGPVSVADYLQRETLLQRQADGSLVAALDGTWAGNLASDVDQQVLRQLAWRLDSQRLTLAPAPTGFVPQLQVKVAISRLDSGPQQPAVLGAQWRVLDTDGQLRESRLVRLEEQHTGGLADQVRAQSLVLQLLVEQLAVAIRPLAEQSPVETPVKPTPAPARSRAEKSAPKIPTVEPVRNNLEVFRF